MDPASLLLVLGLIVRVVELAPEIVSLIERAASGEEITPVEIERIEALVNDSVSRWNKAGDTPEKE